MTIDSISMYVIQRSDALFKLCVGDLQDINVYVLLTSHIFGMPVTKQANVANYILC